MGLDIYLDWADAPKRTDEFSGLNADIPSEKYPEHMCKRNYLRSSYNGGGFNSVVRNLIDEDLYTIFAPIGANLDEYELRPTDEQLQASRVNAEQVLETLRNAPRLGVTFERAVSLRPQDGIVTSEEAALATYILETTRDKQPFGDGGWSNARGVFYPTEPLEVHGILPGRGILGDIGVYLVFKKDLDWYIQMCEIVIEFIDEALSHPERTVRWSG